MVATLKIRRVKCDEGRPICARCKTFGVKCDGYPLAAKVPPKATSQCRQLLLPKLAKVNVPSVLKRLSIIDFDNDNEKIYFLLFQEKTSNDIAPYFDQEAWRRLILQSCHIPSIRYGVLAIVALDRITMDALDHRHLSLDSVNGTTFGVHHRMAIKQYTKAIKSMRDAITGGNQDLRITLIACLLTAVFEAFHGNYSLANAQVRIGVDLLYEWKATFPKNRFTLGHESPNPNVIETDLCQTFGRLELTTVYPDDTVPLERHEARKSHEAEILRSMPEVFNSLQEARVYLEVLLRRLEHYYYALGVWPTETVFTDSPIDGESHRNLVCHTDKYGIPSEEPLEAQSQRFIPVRITTMPSLATPTYTTTLPMKVWKLCHNAIILVRNTTMLLHTQRPMRIHSANQHAVTRPKKARLCESNT